MKTKKFETAFGNFTIHPRSEELRKEFPMVHWEQLEGKNSRGQEISSNYPVGFRQGLDYKLIGHNEHVDIHLAVISPGVGHVLIERGQPGWFREEFVVLKNGKFPKTAEFEPYPGRWSR